jgi:outer membrane protein assembly factor BamB
MDKSWRTGLAIMVAIAIVAATFLVRLRSRDKEPSAPLQWTFKLGSVGTATPALGTDGTVYVSNATGLTALDRDGTVKWQFKAGQVMGSPAVGEDGTIYIIGSRGLYAVTPSGGAMWEGPRGLMFDDGKLSPVLRGSTVIYVNELGGIAALPFNNLDEYWRTQELSSCSTCQVVAGGNGSIYLPQSYRGLAAIRTDGSLLWEATAKRGHCTTPAVLADNTVVTGCEKNAAVKLSTDGREVWVFATTSTVDSSPSIDRDGNIYFGSEDGTVYCVDADGHQRWALALGGQIKGTPALAGDGTIYLGSTNRYFYAIRADGTLKWRAPTSEGVVASATISADGMIYVVDLSGTAYAFSEKNGGLMSSAWPKYKHDRRNTGVAE